MVATTAVANTLLEGLGYTTTQTQASQQIVFSGIQRGQIDFFLGYWKPLMDDNIKPFLADKSVRVLNEPGLSDGISSLAVPTYLADAGLKTYADIAKFKDQLNGKIYGIDPGTGANTTIKKMIDTNQFGLAGFELIESSESAMLAAVTREARSKKPVVFFGWKPHPMNIKMDVTYLTGSEDVFGADEGLATVWTVTAPELAFVKAKLAMAVCSTPMPPLAVATSQMRVYAKSVHQRVGSGDDPTVVRDISAIRPPSPVASETLPLVRMA